jgi:Bacterial regulatory protein, Fis family
MTQTLLDDGVLEQAYESSAGNVAEAAAKVGVARSTAWDRLKKLGHITRPLAGGSVDGMKVSKLPLPAKGKVARYLLTSAQNNTYLNEPVWKNLLVLAKHYDAQILVSTFTYNKNRFGKLSVKRGTATKPEKTLWYDARLTPYLCDNRVELAPSLVFCAELNILPTAQNPLSGLEVYAGRASAIFPHTRQDMRSIAAMRDSHGVKLNYCTGTVTKKNYVQKKQGLLGEFNHIYGALLVEVTHEGVWFVRQVDAGSDGALCDLTVVVRDGVVTTGERAVAVTWGDWHSTSIDPTVKELAVGTDGILDVLRPKYQFAHDLLEGVAISHHAWHNCHERFKAYQRGLHDVTQELKLTVDVLKEYTRKDTQLVVVSSNHDSAWINRWLREWDYKTDPANAILFLEAQLAMYKAIERKDKAFNILEWCLGKLGYPKGIKFLGDDESFKTCSKSIENGIHGHNGVNGSRATPEQLSRVGRKSIIAHSHTAGIFGGLFVAGTSATLNPDYSHGPSSWSHSHVVTYANKRRAIITCYGNRWRA